MIEKFPQNLKEEKFDIETSALKEAYILLNAQTPLELSRNYTAQEQIHFKDHTWDYENTEQIHNIIKNIIESVDENSLHEDEKEWRNEILWFWYHHAISVAGWKRDTQKQKEFSEMALRFQGNNPNILTKTMYLLVHGNLDEAEEWVTSKKGDDDYETATEMLSNYKVYGTLWPEESA